MTCRLSGANPKVKHKLGETLAQKQLDLWVNLQLFVCSNQRNILRRNQKRKATFENLDQGRHRNSGKYKSLAVPVINEVIVSGNRSVF
jgi:hypothetical protein